jgi:hypothetical protein
MGTDMWGAVGRLKSKEVAAEDTDGAQFVFWGDRKVNFADFEIYSGDETNFARDRRLYDFLGDHFPVISTLPDLDAKQEATKLLVDWLNEEYAKLPAGQRIPGRNGEAFSFMGGEIYDDAHFIGDRNYALHFVSDLRAFDYDQVVQTQEQCYEGKTYRELFSPWWFGFLDWCVDQHWEFVIIGFIY